MRALADDSAWTRDVSDECGRQLDCPTQSRQNSLPSGSAIVMNPFSSGGFGSIR